MCLPVTATAFDFSYTGRIVDASGAPTQGSVDITVRFFGSAKDSDQLGRPYAYQGVALSDWVFQLVIGLDPADQLAVFGDGTRQVYLEIEAGGNRYPRQVIAAVPLALRIPVDSDQFEFATDSSKLTLRQIEIAQVRGLDEALANNAMPPTISDSRLATITSAGKVTGSAITTGTISGAAAFYGSGGVNTTGPVVSSGNVIIDGTGSAVSELRFADRDGSNFVGLKAAETLSTNLVWTLPAVDGSAGSLLQTDGNGGLSWMSPGGGGDMFKANNLQDIPDKYAARNNLGLGAIATLTTIDSAAVTNGTLIDADISSAANIATSKLSGLLTEVAGSGLGTLATMNSVSSALIDNSAIVDADIAAAAAIATSKISGSLLAVAGHGLGTLASMNQVPLVGAVSGTLPVASGGTGNTTLTANSVLLGNGTSALQTVAPGDSGNLLTSNGTTWASTAPTWTN